jgi:hypothetical protein
MVMVCVVMVMVCVVMVMVLMVCGDGVRVM